LNEYPEELLWDDPRCIECGHLPEVDDGECTNICHEVDEE